MEKVNINSKTSASFSSGGNVGDNAEPHGRYIATLRDAEGNVKWEIEYDNLVTTQGKNDMLDKYLAGSAYTGAFYMGLISGTTGYSTGPAATDTAASHAGWAEAAAANAPAYGAGARPTLSWNAASGGVKATAAAASYTFTSGGVVKGSFIATSSTKDGTTGVMLSAGLFSASGGVDKTVAANDTLTVTYQLSM